MSTTVTTNGSDVMRVPGAAYVLDAAEHKEMTFIGAMRDFFGVLPGQTSIQFIRELRELSADSELRSVLIQGLERNGYKITTG